MQGAWTILGENGCRVVAWLAFPELQLRLPRPSSCQTCLASNKLPMVCFASLDFSLAMLLLFQELIQGPY